LEKIAGEQVKMMEDKLGEERRLLEVRLAERTKQFEALSNQTRTALEAELNKVICLRTAHNFLV
jgi:hypothetical protein